MKTTQTSVELTANEASMVLGNTRVEFLRRLWESKISKNQSENKQSLTNKKECPSENKNSKFKSFKSALIKLSSKKETLTEDKEKSIAASSVNHTLSYDITLQSNKRKHRHKTFTLPNAESQTVENHSIVANERLKPVSRVFGASLMSNRLGCNDSGASFNTKPRSKISFQKEFTKLQNFWTRQENKSLNDGLQKRCIKCKRKLKETEIYVNKDLNYCEEDYELLFVQNCFKCNQQIFGPILIAGTHRFHPECFQCCCCQLCISDDDLYSLYIDTNDNLINIFCNKCASMSSSAEQTIENECKLVVVVDFYPCHDHSIPPEGPDFQHCSMAYGLIVGKEKGHLTTNKNGARKMKSRQMLLGFTNTTLKTGLQIGDVFLQVNGLAVNNNVLDLVDRLANDQTPLKVTVRRTSSTPFCLEASQKPKECAHNATSDELLTSDDQPETIEPENKSSDDVTNGIPNLSSTSDSQNSDTTVEIGLAFGKVDDDIFSEVTVETTDAEGFKKCSSKNESGDDEESSTTLDEASAQSSNEQLDAEKTPYVVNTREKDEFVFAIPKLRSQESILRRKNKKRRRFKRLDNYSTLPDRFVGTSSDEENITFENSKVKNKSESVSPVRRCQSLKYEGIMRNIRDSHRNSLVDAPLSETQLLNNHQQVTNFAAALPNRNTENSDLVRSESMKAVARKSYNHRVFRACDLIWGEELGQGFFGTVTKATLRETGEVMVVKQLNSLDPETENSFLKEVKVMKHLSHQNVVKFLGILFKEDKRLSIVSEFVERGTLSSVLQNQEMKLSWTTRLKMTSDISSGMSYLHSMSIVHRDLNTSNCFVKENGTVVVADFGLARVIPNTTCSSKKGGRFRGKGARKKRYTIVGAPYWMAPEMTSEMPYTELVDVFAFGIVCCEIIGRVEADPDILPRRSHDFGLDVRAFYDQFDLNDCGCPSFLFAIAVKSASVDPDNRPSFKVLDDWLQALVMKGEFPSYPEPPLLTAMIRQVFEEHKLPLDADNMYYVPLNDVDVKRMNVLNESYC